MSWRTRRGRRPKFPTHKTYRIYKTAVLANGQSRLLEAEDPGIPLPTHIRNHCPVRGGATAKDGQIRLLGR
jgi:hypothetical protein